MFNFVNEESFFAWYEEKSGLRANKKALLDELSRQYMSSRRGEFILPAEKSLSAQEEVYPFSFENIGCCGASTMYFYL